MYTIGTFITGLGWPIIAPDSLTICYEFDYDVATALVFQMNEAGELWTT